MIARSAGGRRIAAWRAEKPPQLIPNMPDRAGAPRPRREPVDDGEVVEDLALGVLVLGDARGCCRCPARPAGS